MSGNLPHWQPGAGGRINLVTNDGQIVAYVLQLSRTEWAWDVLRYPNAAGRKRTKQQAQDVCLADWKRCTDWTQG